MKISIVMAVYNGEKYIEKQLQSILLQTRKADEVIICDDSSTDRTVEFVQSYININNLNNWYIKINSFNQGYIENFYNGLYMTSGDIIFFSDQDDIWKTDKLQSMCEVMINNNILALSGSVTLIDSEGKRIKNSKSLPFYGSNTNKVKRNEFNSKNAYSIVPGCTLAIRRELVKYTYDMDLRSISHDFLFWNLATIMDGAYYLDKDVIEYRVHNTNSSGATIGNRIGRFSLKERIEAIEQNKRLVSQLLNIIESKEVDKKDYKKDILMKNLNILSTRILLLSKRNIKYLPKLFINNKYYHSFTGFIGDIAYILNINMFAGKLYWNIIKNKL